MEGGGVWGKRPNAPLGRVARRDKNRENPSGTRDNRIVKTDYIIILVVGRLRYGLNRVPESRTRVRL